MSKSEPRTWKDCYKERKDYEKAEKDESRNTEIKLAVDHLKQFLSANVQIFNSEFEESNANHTLVKSHELIIEQETSEQGVIQIILSNLEVLINYCSSSQNSNEVELLKKIKAELSKLDTQKKVSKLSRLISSLRSKNLNLKGESIES